jgi:hypothetical protein
MVGVNNTRLSFLAALATLLQCLWGVSLDGLHFHWLATAINVLPPFLSFLPALVSLLQREPSSTADLAQLPAGSASTRGPTPRAAKSRARTT